MMGNERTQVLNPESLSSFEFWVQKTEIKLIQVNGQRKYGGPPPDWTGPAPGPGCEVFISQIPRDVYEDRLIPLFQHVGPLYEFRLMMNFSGQNRGFAYAKYGNPQSAGAAIRILHQHELQKGVRLAVRKSTEKRQLCLSELPPRVEQDRLLQVLRGLTEGVEALSLRVGKEAKSCTAVVHYTSHYAASMAKKVLCEAFKKKFGVTVAVKWVTFSAKPRQDDEDLGEMTPSPPPGFPQMPAKPCPTLQRRPLNRLSLRERPSSSSSTYASTSAAGRCQAGPRLSGPSQADAVTLLQRLCDLFKVGAPLYNLQYSHTGHEGFLYFAFRVAIPSVPLPFMGMVQILPGTSAAEMQDEVRRAAAEHVLKSLCAA